MTHTEINSLATGTAYDRTGTYRVNYHNHQSLTIQPDGTTQALWTDTFSLHGTGDASGLHVGFTWRITFNADGSVAAVEMLSTRGDPLDPATLAPHCDPI